MLIPLLQVDDLSLLLCHNFVFEPKVEKDDKYSKKVIKYLHVLNKCHIFVVDKGNDDDTEHKHTGSTQDD